MDHVSPPSGNTQAPRDRALNVTLANRLIRRLQDQLLALSDMDDAISPQDIERAAKAISLLVRGLQDADGYLGAQSGEELYGYRPKPETYQQFLIKLKHLVSLGVLDQLDE